MAQKYTAAAKWFHWLIVFLVGVELLLGVSVPSIRHNTTPSTIINLHFSFGLTIVAVMLLRAFWRITHRSPALPAGTSRWQAWAANLTHFAFYILLFLIPFAGWLWANAEGWQIKAFWLISMPTLVPAGWSYTWLAADAHVYLVVLICVLIAIHIIASLWHWYVKKDDVLERMLPEHSLTTRAFTYFNRFR